MSASIFDRGRPHKRGCASCGEPPAVRVLVMIREGERNKVGDRSLSRQTIYCLACGEEKFRELAAAVGKPIA